MARKYRHHTQEFKLDAVRLLRESGKTMVEQAEELGIDDSTLARWREELETRRGAEAEASDARVLSKDEQIKLLTRENRVLKEERDFLKKATAFFAKESR